jgi:hypothetical protein
MQQIKQRMVVEKILRKFLIFKEAYFFHGTDVNKIDSIARNGFDQRLP